MRTIVKGKNIEVPERVRLYAERKLDRIDRLLDDRAQALLELSIEHHRSGDDDSHIAEITLLIDGQTVRGHASGRTHQAAIDVLTDRVERRTVDHKQKPRDRLRAPEVDDARDRAAPGTADAKRQPRIVKTKRFAIEPMFEEDAVAAMEELGHDFFLFVDAEHERVALLYRRVDGDYGLIEPIVGGGYSSGYGNGLAAPGRGNRSAAT